MSLASVARNALLDRFQQVRRRTEQLLAPIPAEDMNAQSMTEASPAKWHAAHTSWFFATFLLESAGQAVGPAAYRYLFNSYYQGVGERYPRARRGLMLRPTVAEVGAYREAVDTAMVAWIDSAAADDAHAQGLLELGCQHEEQHQELILTDLKHAYGQAPSMPIYRCDSAPLAVATASPDWIVWPGGLVDIGADEASGAPSAAFAYDNEGPRHQVYLAPFALATRLVTAGG